MAPQTDGCEPAPGDSALQTPSVMGALSARLRGPLQRYFRNRHIPRDEVDDLVQEVFLRLSGRAGIDRLERLDAYVFATASNLLRDRHRHLTAHAAGAHESYDEAIHGSLQCGPEPERAVLGTQIVGQLVAALYELPERMRAVFSLYHFEELSHAEIARQLGIAVSTVEKNMARANAHLLNRLGL